MKNTVQEVQLFILIDSALCSYTVDRNQKNLNQRIMTKSRIFINSVIKPKPAQTGFKNHLERQALCYQTFRNIFPKTEINTD